jgi:hypothetical protein
VCDQTQGTGAVFSSLYYGYLYYPHNIGLDGLFNMHMKTMNLQKFFLLLFSFQIYDLASISSNPRKNLAITNDAFFQKLFK